MTGVVVADRSIAAPFVSVMVGAGPPSTTFSAARKEAVDAGPSFGTMEGVGTAQRPDPPNRSRTTRRFGPAHQAGVLERTGITAWSGAIEEAATIDPGACATGTDASADWPTLQIDGGDKPVQGGGR